MPSPAATFGVRCKSYSGCEHHRHLQPNLRGRSLLFPTTDFAIFFCVVFTASWLLMPYRAAWKIFMTAASYVFYAWWDPGLVWLLAAVTVTAQLGAIWVNASEPSTRRRTALSASVGLVLLPLLWFKYYGFISVTAADLFGRWGAGAPLPLLQIVLPVGISFYTFMAISYVVDIYRKELAPAGWLDLSLYLSFFPHLVAGPIVRAGELIPQFATARDPARIDVGHAARLIFRGLFKKVVVSSFLATQIVDPVFADPSGYSSLDVLFAIYAYSIVIYSDFSGYTDIAIGVAELLGFGFPHNFDCPYIARSLQDFWRRWHITLSRWLRDYLYIPLGGSRTTSERVYFNILLTMLLGGLWHGAGWTFMIWGAIHGVGQATGHFRRSRTGRTEKRADGPLVRARQIFITFHIVSFAWIFFRADSVGQAWDVISSLVTNLRSPELLTVWVAAIVLGAIAAQFVGSVPTLAASISAGWKAFGASSPLAQGTVGAVALFAITTLGPEGVAPFIYFRF